MQIALLQNNPHLGNYTENINSLYNLYSNLTDKNFSSSMTMYKANEMICLTSSFALCGNPWQSISPIGAFSNRMQEFANELTKKDFYCLTQSFLPQTTGGTNIREHSINSATERDFPCGKPVWCHHAHKQTKLFPESLFDIEYITFFAPHNVQLSDIKNLAVPAEANIVYLACSFKFHEATEVESILISFAKRIRMPVVYMNTCGATDGIVYAGQSMLISQKGEVLARLKSFEEDSFVFEFNGTSITCAKKLAPKINYGICAKDALSSENTTSIHEARFFAASLAIKDYAKKCNIKKAVIGVSGGMDSALISALACEALGAQNVIGIMMPSQYNSEESLTDAMLLLKNLGMEQHTIPITDITEAFEKSLAPAFSVLQKSPDDMTSDNLQARTRGDILMAYANKVNGIVIGTGNKSEAAMGYCTLYGDTVGALEPLADIYKTDVYAIAKWYNEWKNATLIPQNIFDKEPSAELRPNQKDSDTLPPYPLLDRILKQILEEGIDPNAISDPELSDEQKKNILTRLARSEFKRKQSPFVVELSTCAFGQVWSPPVSAKAF